MLELIISGAELFDEEKEEFINVENTVLQLEHSLVSLSKWESKFRKPFLGPHQKSREEVVGYIEAMTLSGNFSLDVYSRLTKEHLDQINEYLSSEQSATTFRELPGQGPKGRGEVITSELVYYWMVSYSVPMECENWHLNRLFNLLRICNIKNSKQKKMSKSQMASQYRSLNEQRRAQLGTNG